MTVLMTVYNGLPYLREAVESVVRQTFREFELLIVDDASRDGSWEYLQRVGDPRIHLVRNAENRGQAASLNHGLTLARGAYVARLDQDDRCLSDRLARQVAQLDARPDVAVVGTWAYYASSDGRRTSLVGMPIDDYGAFLGALLTFVSPMGHPTVMFRRSAVVDAGGYDVSYAPCEDYALWCRLALRRRGAMTLRQPLTMLRLHAGQQSHTQADAQRRQAERAHRQLLDLFCDSAEEADTLGHLLRMDERFWSTCRSREAVQAALEATQRLLGRVHIRMRLTPSESRSLLHRIRWWLGRAACLAALQRRPHSAPLYRFALRGGASMLRYPAILLYPVARLFAPLAWPRLRRVVVGALTRISQQKYVVRLLLDRLRGRRAQPDATAPR